MKILRRLAFACLFVGCCTAVADEARPAPQLYSFAELYRLTVQAAPDALVFAPVTVQPQIHVAAAESFVSQPSFTVTQVPSTKGWMLLLAGVAAASWVAHRRLTSPY